MKQIAKEALRYLGYEITKYKYPVDPASLDRRPVGRMETLLVDLKIRGLDPKAILDVGANCGSWSRLAKSVYPDANFYLIEPQAEMEEQLADFTKEFTDSEYFLNGAGAKNEVLTLTLWDDLAGSSFLPDEDESLLEEGRQRKVEIVTIDGLIQENRIEIPDLMKLDIQGFELEALKGANKTFGHTEVYIIETSLFSFSDVPGMPMFSEVVNFMLERDYVVYDLAGFARRPLDGALGQCDICFVKKDGFLRSSNDWQ
jgi:FkbM family methyltransferase